jgi:uncharacterized membrane protein
MRTVSESLREYGRGVAGGLLFSLPLLYTMEVWWAGFTSHPWRLPGLAALSLALSALVLYYSEFAGSRRHVVFDRRHDVLVGVVVTYAVALAASAAILLFFGRFDGQALATCVAQTVVLGVAATLGSSAGRLLLQ